MSPKQAAPKLVALVLLTSASLIFIINKPAIAGRDSRDRYIAPFPISPTTLIYAACIGASQAIFFVRNYKSIREDVKKREEADRLAKEKRKRKKEEASVK